MANRSSAYFSRLTSRILKSFEANVAKQTGYKDIRGFSVHVKDYQKDDQGNITVNGTFEVSSEQPVKYAKQKMYSGHKITWSQSVMGSKAGFTSARLVTETTAFSFVIPA